MDRRAPDPARETTRPLAEELRVGLERALRARGAVDVDTRTGTDACVILALLPDGRRFHEVFVFSRGKGAVDRCIDYVDGVVQELVESGGFLPLDWEGRPFDGGVVFVRSEVRDYEAEEQAARLLGEAPPVRGLGGTELN